jgi:hypothetical protein
LSIEPSSMCVRRRESVFCSRRRLAGNPAPTRSEQMFDDSGGPADAQGVIGSGSRAFSGSRRRGAQHQVDHRRGRHGRADGFLAAARAG